MTLITCTEHVTVCLLIKILLKLMFMSIIGEKKGNESLEERNMNVVE